MSSIETPQAPVRHDEEWANALTHGGAALASVIGAVVMARAAAGQTLMTTFCCMVFIASALAVFVASTLSHFLIYQPRLLNHLRAWDQGLIYVMISATYTPLIWRYSDESIRAPLLVAIWIAALAGFYSKVFAQFRVNSTGPISYLLLGWLPSFGLIGSVPGGLAWWMIAGGMLYCVGIAFLMNDHKRKYMHAAWHFFVMLAATCHFLAVYQYVALQ